MAKTKLVRVPATTNNITKGIINLLRAHGHFAFRVNNTGIYDPIKKTFRKGNGEPGTPDIICCLRFGLFLAVEVKNKQTKDESSKSQLVFADKVSGAGGIYMVAQSYSEFDEWFTFTILGR